MEDISIHNDSHNGKKRNNMKKTTSPENSPKTELINIKYNIDNILLNLKIISRIKKYNKLYSKSDNNILQIDDNYTLYQGIIRWYSNENRIKTLDTIENITNDIFNVIKQILEDKLDIDSNNILTYNKSNLLQQIHLDLINSLEGLKNLKFTYINDKIIEARLDIVINKIGMYITKISKMLTIKYN